MIGVIEPDQLLIERKLLLVVGVVLEQPAEQMRLVGLHDTLEGACINRIVAGEVDGRDAGTVTFVDHESDADAVALRLLGTCSHADLGKTLIGVGETDAFHICLKPALTEGAPAGQIDHGQKVLVREALVALEKHGGNKLLTGLGHRLGNPDERYAWTRDRGCKQDRKRQKCAAHELGGFDHILIASVRPS